MIISIVLAALGSSGLFGLITYLIQRKDTSKQELEEIKHTLNKLERDSCRTQLLLLMRCYGDDTHEIMILAQHYFEALDGNWYADKLFRSYCEEHNIEIPSWVK